MNKDTTCKRFLIQSLFYISRSFSFTLFDKLFVSITSGLIYTVATLKNSVLVKKFRLQGRLADINRPMSVYGVL